MAGGETGGRNRAKRAVFQHQLQGAAVIGVQGVFAHLIIGGFVECGQTAGHFLGL